MLRTRALAAALLALAAFGNAQAQSFSATLGLENVSPASGNGVIAGANADVNDDWGVTGSVAYHFNERWSLEVATGLDGFDHDVALASADSELDLPPNSRAVATHVAGNVWQVNAQPGDLVNQGDPVVVVESMKMEISVAAPVAGRVTHLFCEAGGQVAAGQDLFVIQSES